MKSQREETAPAVDMLELAGLFLLPTLGFGVCVTVLGSDENLVVALFAGAMFGSILVSMRRAFYAVRTENGIERRRRTYSSDPDENPWVRIASIEYDEKYDRILAIVLGFVGIAAFATIPFVDGGDSTVLRLVLVGLFGSTTSLLVYGSLNS